MSDKAPDITVKIKVDREELDCAIRDIEILYEKIKEISAYTGGVRSADAEVPPSSDAPSGACRDRRG